ncbi:MAG: SUMF1/EgtB/PvdO family nonheme iron enzyme [Candidatus Riflebacteria bacterium]|nr:SUMF1/EgtB/PvdO family nonheme iron enzyme [Candidatus Riflebacteria bacterium]
MSSAESKPVDFPEEINNSIGMRFQLIHPGTFSMGSATGEADEKPAHQVTLTKPFYISVFPVTQYQYHVVMDYYSAGMATRDLPKELITWEEASKFCQKLGEKEQKEYRLPTEAEWEYCCRAGTTTMYFWGDFYNGKYAWTAENSQKEPHFVGQKKANLWGLHDMSGNVWEWCQDWYDPKYYSKSPTTDPLGPDSGKLRVLRGGSYLFTEKLARSSSRSRYDPKSKTAGLGFRVVLGAKISQ